MYGELACKTILSSQVGQEVPVKRGQVLDEIEMQDKITEELHSAIQRLQSRLSPILSPENTLEGGPKNPTAPKCDLAENIRGCSGKIAQAIERINSIHRRCEL